MLFSEKSYSGESVLLKGDECGVVNVPLHHVFLTSELVCGPVTRAITQKVKLSKPLSQILFHSSEYDLTDTFSSRIFSDENNGYSDVSMTQSSENIFR